MPIRSLLVLSITALLAACAPPATEVSAPFYVMRVPDEDGRALYRCPEGPDRGCAIDGLPGPDVFAAGADRRYVVVAQRRDGRETYFYFRRVPDETSGWGNNPERIVGPLDKARFDADAARLELPPLSRTPPL